MQIINVVNFWLKCNTRRKQQLETGTNTATTQSRDKFGRWDTCAGYLYFIQPIFLLGLLLLIWEFLVSSCLFQLNLGVSVIPIQQLRWIPPTVW